MYDLLFISLTNKCNKSCDYCPIAKWRNNPEFPNTLTLEYVIEKIHKLKPTHVEITGGEPTLVPWLNDLTDFLDEENIIYLVKSNGYKRCRNQITAWHKGEPFPANYDKILIIKDIEGWEDKVKHCENNKIPYGAIEKDGKKILRDNPYWNSDPNHFRSLFMVPESRIYVCHEERRDLEEWIMKCPQCKAVDDFARFL